MTTPGVWYRGHTVTVGWWLATIAAGGRRARSTKSLAHGCTRPYELNRMFHPQGPTLLELTRQALSSTRKGYDLLAPRFDYTPFRTPAALLERVAPAFKTVDRALDLCCGTGAGLLALRPYVRQELVGIDFSPGMLAEARRRLADTPGEARVTLVEGDVLELTYAEEFDLVTCFGAFGHIPEADESRFVAAIHRALRPGGRFVFVTSWRPGPLDGRAWLLRGFNLVMRVRNALVRPPFVMYYLSFLLPDVQVLLERHGFRVEVEPLEYEGRRVACVTATKA